MVYERAERQRPTRWPGEALNWEVNGPVALNTGNLREIERKNLTA